MILMLIQTDGIKGFLTQSGREDSNLRPLDPQSSALTRLRYAPYRCATREPHVVKQARKVVEWPRHASPFSRGSRRALDAR